MACFSQTDRSSAIYTGLQACNSMSVHDDISAHSSFGYQHISSAEKPSSQMNPPALCSSDSNRTVSASPSAGPVSSSMGRNFETGQQTTSTGTMTHYVPVAEQGKMRRFVFMAGRYVPSPASQSNHLLEPRRDETSCSSMSSLSTNSTTHSPALSSGACNYTARDCFDPPVFETEVYPSLAVGRPMSVTPSNDTSNYLWSSTVPGSAAPAVEGEDLNSWAGAK
jgi:hypothetical protein